MSTYAAKPSSLIERKKQQWAREREELAGLSAPWGFVDSTDSISSEHVSKLATPTPNADIFLRRESTASRRQSLPPICKKQTYSQNERYDKEMGGETSGYGSDNPNNTPEYFPQTTWNQNLGYESSSSARDDRAKWTERGGIGKYWESQDVKYHKMDDPPSWVKRGIQEGTELIISNTSPAESPEQDYGDQQRPYTSSSISQTRTYIRGQNNPVDPVELAQREMKRQAARIHQEAVRQQLEEREQKRKEERERQIREEREEERRIEREQQIERNRREREQQLVFEKQEQERKRKQALEEAIKLAEKAAMEQKLRQKMLRQVNLNINENVLEKEKVLSPRPIVINNQNEEDNKNNSSKPLINNKTEIENDISNNNVTNNINLNQKIENDLNSNNSAPENSPFATPQHQPEASSSKLKVTNTENAPRILQTPFDSFPNFPFAILMPTFASGPNASIALPMQISTETRCSTPRSRTENRVLTPTLYRQRRFCDSSTQTDKIESDQSRELKLMKEKLNNLELSDDTRNKSESKTRAGEKFRENSSERPKWGANRPPTRYLKQSEKDPFYQRKKIRQKIRQIKIFDDKSINYSPHSSDDSQIASPRSYRKKGYIEKRRTRALWQKNGHLMSRNMQVYQTEIIPLESDSNTIYYKKPNCVKCCCDCRSHHHNYKEELKVVDILKIEHTPRADDTSLPDCNIPNVNQEILDKLTSLHNGLMTKQEQWENSPLTPSLTPPNRITEINH